MSAQNFIDVIPWDPESEPHVERLRQQRIACGWGVENIDNWRNQQLAHQKLIIWLVLKPSNPCYEALVDSHARQFPQEKDPLWDTASVTFARQKRRAFIPIGHVSLEFMAAAIIDPAQRRIGATSFFISPALRGQDFARQAIETIRAILRHHTRFVVAEAPVRETDEAVERYEKFGDGRPQFSVADWYMSMGWKRLKKDKRIVMETDSEGRIWKVELVSLELDLWEDGVMEKSRL